MAPTIAVCGYGTGISEAVARRFGREGYQVALVARTPDRLTTGARALEEAGVRAAAFPCDLGDAEAVRAMIREVEGALGPVTVLHWNAYAGPAPDLLTASVDELRAVFSVGTVSLVAAIQAALPGLKSQPGGSVLVTGGGLSRYDAQVDALAVQWNAMGLALGKGAQHKAVRLLHQRLQPDGVFVGEVTVLGAVKGTRFDQGQATLTADTVAERLWELHQRRDAVQVDVA